MVVTGMLWLGGGVVTGRMPWGCHWGGNRGTGAFGHHRDVEVLGLWLKYINQSKLIYKAQ